MNKSKTEDKTQKEEKIKSTKKSTYSKKKKTKIFMKWMDLWK